MPYLCALHGDRERALTGRVQSLAARCKGALAPSGFEEDFLVLAHQLLQFYETIRETSRPPAGNPPIDAGGTFSQAAGRP